MIVQIVFLFKEQLYILHSLEFNGALPLTVNIYLRQS